MLKELTLENHTIITEDADTTPSKAIILNDGNLLIKHQLKLPGYLLVGIIPNNRLNEYSPWPLKSLRQNTPDFGGKLNEYHHDLGKIVTSLKELYNIDDFSYGGYSLGGLAAIFSLYSMNIFSKVFAICPSLWYEGAVAYFEENDIYAKAKVFILNGEKEGEKHNNALRLQPQFAKTVHQIFKDKTGATTIMDAYGHHDKQNERLNQALSWISQN